MNAATLRCTALAAGLALAACKTPDPGQAAGASAREPLRCPDRFAACAPPAHFDESTDALRLEPRKQVEVALRMDVPERLSRDAARAIRDEVQRGDLPTLLGIQEMYEDAWAALGKCQCPGEKNGWDRVGVGALLAKRLPPAELRSPKTWEDRMVAQLAAMRDLQRRAAMRGVAGERTDDLDAARKQADVALCEAVHGARANLLSDAYAGVVEAVCRRRDADAGPAAAEAAQVAIRRHEKAAACTAPPPAAAPRPAAPAGKDVDEEE